VATSTTTVPAGRKASRRRRSRRNYLKVLLFLSPWVIGFLAFVIYPMLATFYYSFTHYDMLSPPKWVGLSNYRFMFTDDPYFWQSLRNTVWIIVVGVPVQIVFALSTAFVLTRPKRGVGTYRTIYFVPTMVPTVAAALSFVFLLNPGGPIDTVLRFLHIPSPLWFQDPTWSKPALVLLGMWVIGTSMIIFLSALLNVPAQLYEAADIEGAGPWQKFRSVTLPMVSPVVFFSAVIGVIYGFQYFTEAYVAAASVGGSTSTGGPSLGFPQGSTLFYGIWLYEQAFTNFHYGYASAMAWILFLMIMVCTLILIRSSSRWVFYQGGFR
jgi:multiple sugar transport system permease protein